MVIADSSNLGQVIIIKDIGGQSATTGKAILIDTSGSDIISIEGALPLNVGINYFSLTLVSNGSGSWIVI